VEREGKGRVDEGVRKESRRRERREREAAHPPGAL